MTDALGRPAPTCVVLDVSSGGIGGNLKLLDAVRHHTDAAVANARVVLIAPAVERHVQLAGRHRRVPPAAVPRRRPRRARSPRSLARPEEERKPHRRRMVEAARIGERAERARRPPGRPRYPRGLLALLALHAVTGLVAIAFGARLGRRALVVGGLAPVVTLVWLAANLGGVARRRPRRGAVAWVPALGLDLHLRLDGFAALMALLVAGVGVAVFAYSLATSATATPDVGRLAGLLALFAGSMLGLVLADDLLVLYTCWELTSITSYLLIGNDHTDAKARAAALHALLVTGAGGLAMLGGFVLVGQAAGTFQLSAILADPPSGTTGHRRAGADPARRVHQVGAVPVPRLAARRHGGADAGERLPALGHDGEGRRLPARPAGAGVRRRRASGGRPSSASGWSRWSAAGCGRCARTTSSCCSPTGPSASSGFLVVLFGAGTSATGRRLRPAAGPRRLQGGAVHGGGDARPPPGTRDLASCRRSGRSGGRSPSSSS